MNRLFDEPLAVFTERMLKPELQSMDDYADGIKNIVEAQQKVAKRYFDQGSIEAAIPPLQILLHIMAYGHYEGKDISDPSLRKQFKRESVIKSDWYKARLKLKQEKDIAFHSKQVEYLEGFKTNPENESILKEMDIDSRLQMAHDMLQKVSSAEYLKSLEGTIGADPLFK